MGTLHEIIIGDARNLTPVNKDSIELVVTSPPYPMIEMWDDVFSALNSDIETALKEKEGDIAFGLMHEELNRVWEEIYRVLKPGGIACINVGDATRKLKDNFQLYANHSRILHHCLNNGFNLLPSIIWRKTTNAPNKYMGSGMLPPGAYVTLEHEHILVLRKGGKREFKDTVEKQKRYESAFFWEERNNWFADFWNDLKGASQALLNGETRNRSGAYPFELAYRLINMFSIKGDTVLDPFLGTGTTTLAAMSSERSSLGFEIDSQFKPLIRNLINDDFIKFSNEYIKNRLTRHGKFVKTKELEGKPLKYFNKPHKIPVMTGQEQYLKLNLLKSIEGDVESSYHVIYTEAPDVWPNLS